MTKIALKVFSTLLIVVLLVSSLTACGGKKEMIDYAAWPATGLAAKLPTPDSPKIEIPLNTSTIFSATIYEASQEMYDNYVAECAKSGFTIDSESTGYRYNAYNQEGCELLLYFIDNDNEMSIQILPAEEIKEIHWPQNDLTAQLPTPSSNKGKLGYEKSSELYITIAETDLNQFSQYIDDCQSMGFTVDYIREEKYFRAENEKGYALTLCYEGFSTFSIHVEAPETPVATETPSPSPEVTATPEATPTAEATATPSPTPEAATSTPAPSEPAVSKDTVRPEVKEFLESYEAFYDEYIKFMDKYYSTENASLTMLTDYSKMLIKYEDFNKKYDELDDGTFTEAEDKLYIDTQLRVTNKLLKAMENWN